MCTIFIQERASPTVPPHMGGASGNVPVLRSAHFEWRMRYCTRAGGLCSSSDARPKKGISIKVDRRKDRAEVLAGAGKLKDYAVCRQQDLFRYKQGPRAPNIGVVKGEATVIEIPVTEGFFPPPGSATQVCNRYLWMH